MQKVFSVPFNPKLNSDEFNEFVEFLTQYKHLIYDVYFTSRIPPFTQDAMGDIFTQTDDYAYAIEMAVKIQDYTGIPFSATFNNIQVPPTQKNLDLFIYHFKPLYDAGIRVATIPHTHWLATGQIQRVFPELKIKNTILRDVSTAAEVVNLAKVGYDYINLDRDLMRNRDALLRIKTAKEWIKENLGKEIHVSLLANEGCLGNCSMMVEHFEYNNTRAGSAPQYFNDPISRVSCPKWDFEDPSIHLKTANLPPWKEDWIELIEECGIDVFKMHGREAVSRLYETMDIIKRWDENEEFLNNDFQNYIKETNLEEKPIDAWRKIIKNCKFDCWECQFCDKIYKIKSNMQHTDLVKHTVESIKRSGIPTVNIDIPGLTSPRVQTLLNLLGQGVDTYLEIGSYLGATLCAVLKDNPINATSVDAWKEQIQSQDGSITAENNIETFLKNVEKYKGNSNINIVDEDLFNVDVTPIQNSIKLFFYDGPHDEESVFRAVNHYWPALSQEAILVFDDANWKGVVDGAKAGIESCNGISVFEKLMLNDEENKNEWWNGLYITVINK